MLKNKKGATSLSILLLVIMALVLIAASLFVFVTGEGKIERKITDARAVENLYSEEEKIRFFLEGFVEDVLVKSNYNINNFKENVKIEIRKYDAEDIQSLREKIEKGEFSANFDGAKLILTIEPEIKKSFKFEEQKYILKIIPYGKEEKENLISYTPEIKMEFEVKNK